MSEVRIPAGTLEVGDELHWAGFIVPVVAREIHKRTPRTTPLTIHVVGPGDSPLALGYEADEIVTVTR